MAWKWGLVPAVVCPDVSLTAPHAVGPAEKLRARLSPSSNPWARGAFFPPCAEVSAAGTTLVWMSVFVTLVWEKDTKVGKLAEATPKC